MNRDTALALKQIMDCPYKGRLKQVFFEAKALELAVNALAGTNRTREQNQPDFSPRELERLKEAYEILVLRMKEPPGLDDLSRTGNIGLDGEPLTVGVTLAMRF